MDFHQWIDLGLKKPGKRPSELARKLRIGADKVSRMRKGDRLPKASELAIIEDYLGEKAPVDKEFDAATGLTEGLGLTEGHLESSDVLPTEPEILGDQLPIRELETRGAAGAGGTPSSETMHRGDRTDAYKPEGWSFPSTFLRHELRAPAARIVVLETDGDSMEPTIATGERVIIDSGHVLPSPDGIYAIRDDFGNIVVKRLQVVRATDPPRVKIISDNPHHSTQEVSISELVIVGKVVCGFKRY